MFEFLIYLRSNDGLLYSYYFRLFVYRYIMHIYFIRFSYFININYDICPSIQSSNFLNRNGLRSEPCQYNVVRSVNLYVQIKISMKQKAIKLPYCLLISDVEIPHETVFRREINV